MTPYTRLWISETKQLLAFPQEGQFCMELRKCGFGKSLRFFIRKECHMGTSFPSDYRVFSMLLHYHSTRENSLQTKIISRQRFRSNPGSFKQSKQSPQS